MRKNYKKTDNSEDDYGGYIQKTVILPVIQKIFCGMLFRGGKIVKNDIFSNSLILGQMFKVINHYLKGYFTEWCQRNPL